MEGGSLIKSNPEGVRRQLGLDLAPTKRPPPELAGNPLKGQSLLLPTTRFLANAGPENGYLWLLKAVLEGVYSTVEYLPGFLN